MIKQKIVVYYLMNEIGKFKNINEAAKAIDYAVSNPSIKKYLNTNNFIKNYRFYTVDYFPKNKEK